VAFIALLVFSSDSFPRVFSKAFCEAAKKKPQGAPWGFVV
jgi:hypothetical protein